jgi:hypothetical protein
MPRPSSTIADVAGYGGTENGISALFAWGRPAIQLCMWTTPIILLSASPTESLAGIGFYRGCEVILGVLIGGLFLIAADKGLAWARRTRPPRHKKS